VGPVGPVGTTSAQPTWQSLTQHPAPSDRAEYRCEWQPHAATFEANGPHIRSRMRVWVAPEEDVELRDITLAHHGEGPALTVDLASYFEVALASQAADEAHPAFSNLFVQARWDPELRALWFTRRGRLAGDAPVHAVHFVAFSDGEVLATTPCSDRAHALGRGRSVQSPTFMAQSDASNTGLDPVASITLRCVIPRHGTVTLRFATAVANDPAVLVQVIERHRQRVHVDRAWRMASTLAVIALREARMDAQAWHAWQLISAAMAQTLARPQKSMAPIDRRSLWRFGLSGERPLLLVRVPESDGLLMADGVARAAPLWARAGLAVDVVLLDTEPSSYLQPVSDGLTRLVHAHAEAAAQPAHSACKLLVLRAHDLTPLDLHTLRTTARLDLLADGRAPSAVMRALRRSHADDLARRQSQPCVEVPWLQAPPAPEQADVPHFDPNTGGCSFSVGLGLRPQRAWSNVLANPDFGTHVTEAGGGHAWAHNSRLLQITPPSNDALADPAARWLLLQDLDNGRVWNAWPAPWGAAPQSYRIEQGPGWTKATHVHDGIEVTVHECVDSTTRIQQTTLQLRCHGAQTKPRRLRVLAMATWQLGARWADRASVATAPHWCSVGQPSPMATASVGDDHNTLQPNPSTTRQDDVTLTRSGLALMATQTDAGTGFPGTTAFLALRPATPQAAWAFDWTCDRRELFNTHGRGTVPEALGQRRGLGLEPCAALAMQMDVLPGAATQVTLLLGHADTPDGAQRLAEAACAMVPDQRAAHAERAWQARLGTVQVHTPDPKFDVLVNHWLPYQTLACRVWARAGFYQVGGAYGFRDQLQDTMALTSVDAGLLQAQILRCASRQFREGDVQHWWHPPAGAGVRTRFSDDLLWLVAALLRHLDTGGSPTLLDAPVAWLEGSAVADGEEDVYETPSASQDTASVYEHAARALDKSLTFGVHGLPLMGAGDWNDGMNRVGIAGRGESVWLAWFQVSMLEPMAALADARREPVRAHRWRDARTHLLQALETHGWDGAWYRRACFDDGSPLGSAQNDECRIDQIAQAWAVLAGGGDPARAKQAMQSSADHLIDVQAGLVRLLDPPLDKQRPSAGYIQAYPRGVRENGGQYTHATVWSAMAYAQLGDAARAWQAWQFASPAHRMGDPAAWQRYRLEPYAVAADVYGHAPWRGQGGWSWYTGSAGWLLRAGVESLMGLQQRGSQVRFMPTLPPHWPSAQVVLKRQGHQHVFTIVRDGEASGTTLAVGRWLDVDALGHDSRWVVHLTKQPAPLLDAVHEAT
jgi:cyclic beta-1,2-glucan synthetase